MALDSSSSSSSSPGPALALEVGPSEDMPPLSIFHLQAISCVGAALLAADALAATMWRGELLQLSTRLRSTASRSS